MKEKNKELKELHYKVFQDPSLIDKFRVETAAIYLKDKKNHKILEKNYTCDHGQIDVISEDENGVICFNTAECVLGYAAKIWFKDLFEDESRNKLRIKLEKIADEYLTYNLNKNKTCYRFDFIGIRAFHPDEDDRFIIHIKSGALEPQLYWRTNIPFKSTCTLKKLKTKFKWLKKV